MENWNNWNNYYNGFTMTYERTAKYRDGTTIVTQMQVECESEKQAKEFIDTLNRVGKITKEVQYTYRRIL